MMETRIADQEEEKRARERIRQRIADDKVCCSMLKFCLIYTNNSVVLTVIFFCMLIIHPINPLFFLTFLLSWISALKKSPLYVYQSQMKHRSLSLYFLCTVWILLNQVVPIGYDQGYL